MQFIELFAGCGGLSLGLKSVGFNLTFANEFSPMAAESYAFNFLKEDLYTFAKEGKTPKKALWLSSSFPSSQLDKRLQENPFHFPDFGNTYSDLKFDGSNLDGALVVGSIVALNKWFLAHPLALSRVRSSFGHGAVDLVSGGPPCQSFSMAGLRQKDDRKNSLPWEFVKFVELIQPKIVLLENVTGILRPFTSEDGSQFYAWFELAKAFAQIGYVPLCLHINAKYAGVPQNRPRFILLGLRFDVLNDLKCKFNESESLLFKDPEAFYKVARSEGDISIGNLLYRDIVKPADFSLIASSFLKPLLKTKDFISVKDAIEDLKTGARKGSLYASNLDKLFSRLLTFDTLENHEFRSNNELVRRRFRIYQVIEKKSLDIKKAVLAVMRGKADDISLEVWKSIRNEKFFLENKKFGLFLSKNEFLKFLKLHATKKQTQRALSKNAPAPAALSIPDDTCHYDLKQLRTLSVREIARIQSFPDAFIFRSKVTTGGRMRCYEVPQYTQVGNAVPPLLGHALGLSIADLVNRLKSAT